MSETRASAEPGCCLGCLRHLRRFVCCEPKAGKRTVVEDAPKVPREANSLKRVVIFRHGEGRHQTDQVVTKGLGPCLTELGLKQAYGVRTNRVFEKALAESQRPLFAASNLVRAVETMCHAAPGRTIVIQPLLRERIVDEFDWPSRLDLLEQWLHEHHVAADLELYRAALEQLPPTGEDTNTPTDAEGSAVREREYKRYVQALQDHDCTGRIGGEMEASKERAKHLIRWMGEQDCDTLFMASHGCFLQRVNQMASQSWVNAALQWATGSSYPQNCEVREYKLTRRLEPEGWWLSDNVGDSLASTAEAMPHFSALDLPEGRYHIRLASAKCGQDAGWYLTARRTRNPDRRSSSSTYAIVHTPTAECYTGQWSLKRIRTGVYTISFCSKDVEDQPSGWFLTARRSQNRDKRDNDTTFAIIHEPLDPSYVSSWQVLEGSKPGLHRLTIAGFDRGMFLTAHRSRSGNRSPESTYAVVTDGFDEDRVAEWEFELLH